MALACKSASVPRIGSESGNTSDQKMRISRAPSTRADSKRSSGRPLKKVRNTKMAKAWPPAAYGSQKAQRVLSSFRSMMRIKAGMSVNTPGIINSPNTI